MSVVSVVEEVEVVVGVVGVAEPAIEPHSGDHPARLS